MYAFLLPSCFQSWNSIVVFVAEARSIHWNEGCSAQAEARATAFRHIKASSKSPRAPEVTGRWSEREPMEHGIAVWVTHCKGEEGKGSERGRKKARAQGSWPAVLVKSRLSAKRTLTGLKLGIKEQVPGMSLHYGPLKQGKAENTKPCTNSWRRWKLETSSLCSRLYSCWVTNRWTCPKLSANTCSKIVALTRKALVNFLFFFCQ